jgi:hypothetical protein
MIMFCPNACDLCELKIHPEVRCDRSRMGVPDKPVYEPGDMNRMFEKLITEERYQKYQPEVLHTDPYVVRFRNFVSDSEIEALHSTTSGHFERSTDQGATDEFGKQAKVESRLYCMHND